MGALLGGLGIKGIAIILGGLAITAIVGGFYLHYQGIIKDNATLTANNAMLETSLTMQIEANEAAIARIDDFAAALERQQETMFELAETTQQAAATVRRINDVFSRHDFQRLLDARPGLIVRRVNSGTADTLRMLECGSVAGGCEAAGASDAEGNDPAGPSADQNVPD